MRSSCGRVVLSQKISAAYCRTRHIENAHDRAEMKELEQLGRGGEVLLENATPTAVPAVAPAGGEGGAAGKCHGYCCASFATCQGQLCHLLGEGEVLLQNATPTAVPAVPPVMGRGCCLKMPRRLLCQLCHLPGGERCCWKMPRLPCHLLRAPPCRLCQLCQLCLLFIHSACSISLLPYCT